MKPINLPRNLLTMTSALALGSLTLQTHAQDFIVDTFDTAATISAWTPTWDTNPVLSFSTNGATGGALRISAPYYTGAGDWEQAVVLRTFTNALKASDYQTVSVDVKVDPSSVPIAAGQYGFFEIKY